MCMKNKAEQYNLNSDIEELKTQIKTKKDIIARK